MQQRISLITLGVQDLKAATKFYTDVLGWKVAESTPGISFFDLGGLVFTLYPHTEMVKEWGVVGEELSDYRGFALSHNVASEQEVDQVFERLRANGVTILVEPRKVFWGGYSGYFTDPDGNRWEVAHNPFWTVQDDGRISMTRNS